MEDWVKLSLFLCTFGILREFRPSEPYVTKYLNNPPMNFTLQDIYTDIYPVSTYSTMILTIIILLCTDALRYKPIIIFNGLSGIICYVMLIVCRSLFEIQLVEVLYGLFSACDVAYCTYIYSKVDKVHYQEVTSYTHGAYLAGRAISGIASQLLVLNNFISYYYLNFFTLSAMILATLWSCFLPPVAKTVYFHRAEEEENSVETASQCIHQSNSSTEGHFRQGFNLLLKHFVAAFTSLYVVKWIFWWSLATCGYYQMLNYIQVLWEVIDEDATGKKDSNLNGAVEAAYTIFSVIATLACGKAKVDWNRFGELILAVCSMAIGGILIVASQTNSIYVAYAADIFAKIIYHGMITIANSEVAKNINPDSFALIFGITNFIALCLQSVLTLVVNTTLSLPGRTQFVVYGVYFLLLGAFFIIITTISCMRERLRQTSGEEPQNSSQDEAK